MIRLQHTPIVIGYDGTEYTTIPELIDNIGNTVKDKLTNEITNKPLKCNITIIYSSVFEEKPYDKGNGGNIQ